MDKIKDWFVNLKFIELALIGIFLGLFIDLILIIFWVVIIK